MVSRSCVSCGGAEEYDSTRVTMSTRGEAAGQSSAAQDQPAAPEPQKRGRGRPRKQQQVSLLSLQKTN